MLAEPRFRTYEAHLKAAALGGVRPAAVEYAAMFDSPAFFELAERMAGDVDAERMAQIAATPHARAAWLRTAGEGGWYSALRQLARGGEVWAPERLAVQGDIGALRAVAKRAIDPGDVTKAWPWQHSALLHGVDLTVSTMRAHHDGGLQHGEFYDNDFGREMYADGNEGLRLPSLTLYENQRARWLAHEMHARLQEPLMTVMTPARGDQQR